MTERIDPDGITRDESRSPYPTTEPEFRDIRVGDDFSATDETGPSEDAPPFTLPLADDIEMTVGTEEELIADAQRRVEKGDSGGAFLYDPETGNIRNIAGDEIPEDEVRSILSGLGLPSPEELAEGATPVRPADFRHARDGHTATGRRKVDHRARILAELDTALRTLMPIETPPHVRMMSIITLVALVKSGIDKVLEGDAAKEAGTTQESLFASAMQSLEALGVTKLEILNAVETASDTAREATSAEDALDRIERIANAVGSQPENPFRNMFSRPPFHKDWDHG